MLAPAASPLRRRRILKSALRLVTLAVLLCSYEVPLIAQAGGSPRHTAARQAFEEGEILFKQGSAESVREAIRRFEEALETWRAAHYEEGEVEALLCMAAAYYRLDEHENASAYYIKSLHLSRALGNRSVEAQALNGLGNVCFATGDTAKARDYYTQSLEPRRAAGDRAGEAYTLANIGSAYWAEGEPQKAIQYQSRTLSIMRELGHKDGQAAALYNIGLIYASLSENAEALNVYRQALTLQQETGDRRAEAATLNNIGLVYGALGENQKALDYHNQALPLRRAVGHRAGEAITFHNIGDVYAKLGENQKALVHYEKARTLSSATGDRRGHAYTVDSIGVVYWKLGAYKKALSNFEQALRLFRELGHKTGVATALEHIGSTYFALGDTQAATARYNDALTLFREVEDRPGEVRILVKVGELLAHSGKSERALEYCNQSLSLARSIGDRQGEANALYQLAAVERGRGNLADAHALIEQGRGIAELLRSSVAAQELRTSYLASVQDYYDLEIDILMRLHRSQPARQFDAAALHVSERSRARSLVETLSASRVSISEGVDPGLAESARGLLLRLEERSAYQARLHSGKRRGPELSAVGKEIEAIRIEHDQIKARIKRFSPRYAEITQPEPLSARQIQSQVLDPNTLLLEYSLGKDRSFLWAVTPSSISSFELPKRAEVEALARRLYDSLTARNVSPDGETAKMRAERLASADEQYRKSARALGDMLLGPVAGELGNKRLLVVTAGALQYIPFAALPTPRREQPPDEGSVHDIRPLVIDHEIVHVPSASTLDVLRREAVGRSPAKRTLVVLADPVFEPDDSRVRRPVGSQPERTAVTPPAGGAGETVDAGVQTGTGAAAQRMPRLVFSRDEALSILSLAPAAQRKQALDFDASRSLALSPELGQYRIVHLATHSIIDTAHPERSGVMLSRVDGKGERQQGFLTLDEIYNLKLSADLVVLSSCETALGKDIRGEGMIGLTRGFMYAGSPRVVATLWKIDDRATSELMKRFYEGMLGERRLPPAAALKAAQTDILRKRGWTHPYYWSAFVIQGDWN
jgi:CHAT domain-containing protein/Tfp pilus assembly protein PilF